MHVVSESLVLSTIDRYRAPECLLTDGHYGHKMDMWSVGCVLFEVMRYACAHVCKGVPLVVNVCDYHSFCSLRPLFPGSNELDQISRIHDALGSPTPNILMKFRKM